MSLPRHHRDERGEAGDMQTQNAQNGEQGSCKCAGSNNRVNCTGNEKTLSVTVETTEWG